ncbi:hypothetical protein ERJ75_000873900 [Trypanosoma vivax]|uniref:Uncharacterized protein n=1 Tax=Trypanosoma vivax (strain Y486) TaxID=1055687 RepID=F9WM23_TRYVY|nr:hypothetical protein ERJ75_000873900 [Trypanosoma vivax]CCD18573.1 hypothetical protein, conserved in T. vivax [Trypanosoma vivax Y486]|eukprot:CCD18573.1 hypothetical protein, conserved in T. vivax [Trypanosoma vivax Y486]
MRAMRRIVATFFCLLYCGTLFVADASYENVKRDLKNKEKTFICNVSSLLLSWNVTFSALKSRALKVNDTVTMMLNNITIYKNKTLVQEKASEAIGKVRYATGNATAALDARHHLMDGIERDFFNMFEGIKAYRDDYVFGHSNLVSGNKRVSEVLGIFTNVSWPFAECDGSVTESLKMEMKKTLDDFNLSSLEDQRTAE